jgi:hypothetical protein
MTAIYPYGSQAVNPLEGFESLPRLTLYPAADTAATCQTTVDSQRISILKSFSKFCLKEYKMKRPCAWKRQKGSLPPPSLHHGFTTEVFFTGTTDSPARTGISE